jgi:hypothetical protein
MSFTVFVVVWLVVFLVLFTLDEVLSVVLYDLSCPELQSQYFGFSIAAFTFAPILPALVAGFVKVLRSDFFKS